MNEQVPCKSCKKNFTPPGKFPTGMCHPCEIDYRITRNQRHIVEVQKFMHANLGQDVWLEAKLWGEKKLITLPESLPPDASVFHPRRKPWNQHFVFVFQEMKAIRKDESPEPLWTFWPGSFSILSSQWDAKKSRYKQIQEIRMSDRSLFCYQPTHWPDLRDCRSQAIMSTWTWPCISWC